uniref:Uncharacterized protein n=1 Tax=Anguilla anguilla TaxID=7936 RepID=A0A0E9U853_ANGAN
MNTLLSVLQKRMRNSTWIPSNSLSLHKKRCHSIHRNNGSYLAEYSGTFCEMCTLR